jgi:hypothetical protein
MEEWLMYGLEIIIFYHKEVLDLDNLINIYNNHLKGQSRVLNNCQNNS